MNNNYKEHLKQYWESHTEKFKIDDDIPEMPVLPKDELAKDFWPEYYKRGAIPKKDLIVGHIYYGTCRNATDAVWLGDKFKYERYKFGYWFDETINHFEDDDREGIDVFIPIRDITENIR